MFRLMLGYIVLILISFVLVVSCAFLDNKIDKLKGKEKNNE